MSPGENSLTKGPGNWEDSAQKRPLLKLKGTLGQEPPKRGRVFARTALGHLELRSYILPIDRVQGRAVPR